VNLTTAIQASAWAEGSRSAVVVIDGIATSWECNHNHHSDRTAEPCRKGLAATAAEWLNDPTLTVIDLRCGLWELRRGPTARRMAVSRRLHYPGDLAATLERSNT